MNSIWRIFHRIAFLWLHMKLAAGVQINIRRRFAMGERIHTENSYKYPLPVFTDMLARAGFAQAQAWTDERGWFAVVHARP